MHHDKQIREVMSSDLTTVEPGASIQDAARRMRSEDVGALPIVEGDRLVGMITDRDITIRAVAEGNLDATVADIASKDIVSIDPQQTLEEAARLMAEHQLRRLPVCEEDGRLVGILAQADVATTGHDSLTGEVVEEISR
ncbi:MAG TPA: CBS domain-containing protein [Gaiellaceae bacterium]|nr:CBS domain-containing protein [Gaiellaceae bacterium]